MAVLDFALNLLAFFQSGFYHRNSLEWAEIDYYLQVRQVQIDTLNNVREDLRDLYQMQKEKIDNALIVATLMLTIGFGFGVEGTFPPPGKVGPLEGSLRVMYAIVAGFALITPFGSMLCLVECRRRVDYFMDRFTHEFYDKLRKHTEKFIIDSSSMRNITNTVNKHTHDLPKVFPRSFWKTVLSYPRVPRAWRCCDRRAMSPTGLGAGLLASPGAGSPVGEVPSMSWDEGLGLTLPRPDVSAEGPIVATQRDIGTDMQLVIKMHNDFIHWWDTWCDFNYRAAAVLQTCAVFFNVLCAAILLGLYLQENYKDTPWMWRAYVIVLGSGLLITIPYSIYSMIRGPQRQMSHLFRHKPHWMVLSDSQRFNGRHLGDMSPRATPDP
eukprot:TRINITY_DN57065_c0_g1_i1.p1 TRINITY_DN57065_c0_g1~~TRINITY_DN57065_c0_g1_i1.p1  ORF type:complete len:391 (-),score=40.67 TRINITY_DN57065_c0_g1_i1:60-1202(-)